MNRVIITATADDCIIEAFKIKDYIVDYVPMIPYQKLLQTIGMATALVVSTNIKVDKQLLDAATNLQMVGRLGSGMENIDVAYAQSKGIACYSSPEGNRHAVAEHSLGLLLGLMNNINKSHAEVGTAQWLRNANRGEELFGRTVGIIGFGNTGSSFANVLAGFNVTVLANDKYKYGFANNNIKEASVEQIARYADVISLNLPLTAETKHFADCSFFNALEKQPYFINASRGKVVDTAALITALQTKKIKAAGLDVIENEDLPSHTEKEKEQLQWLSHQPNVIVTPHIAGYTHEAFFKMSKVLAEKMLG